MPGQRSSSATRLWTVVGVFASDDALDSEMWGDADVVADTYRRGGSRASVTVRLADPQGIRCVQGRAGRRSALKVDVSTTYDYFSKQSEGTSKSSGHRHHVVGSIMAIGAMFGALNCMFAAVATRAREIATLRAIGFRGLPVVVAIMLETMLLALDRRIARRAAGVADLQRLHRIHAGSRHGRAAQLRVQGRAARCCGRAEMGAGDRLHRRPVSGRARRDCR
jgi:hypothetical protein